GHRQRQETPPGIDAFAESGHDALPHDLVDATVLDVGDEQAGRVRAEVDRGDARHFRGTAPRTPLIPRRTSAVAERRTASRSRERCSRSVARVSRSVRPVTAAARASVAWAARVRSPSAALAALPN